jgi:magnesium transporter
MSNATVDCEIMITVYCWQPLDHSGRWLDAQQLRTQWAELRTAPDVLWINLEAPTEEEEQLVFQHCLPVHPLTLEDVRKPRREPDSLPHFPKAEEFPDYLFVVVNPVTLLPARESESSGGPPAQRWQTTQLSAILTRKALITHHYQPLASTQELCTYLAKHGAQAERGPDYLFHLILDSIVDEYADVLDHFDDALDMAEEQVLNSPDRALLSRLLALKREVIHLRKTLVHEREVLARLARGEFELIDAHETVYYRNVYDHLVRFTELMESSRDLVSDLMQTNLAAVSNRTNEIMKVLAMISTIILPMSLIAGIYGMNFETMPELKWVYGYPFALGLMVLTAIAAFIFFRWRKWI